MVHHNNVVLILILCATGTTLANKCLSDCEKFKFGDIPEPKTGYDTYDMWRCVVECLEYTQTCDVCASSLHHMCTHSHTTTGWEP